MKKIVIICLILLLISVLGVIVFSKQTPDSEFEKIVKQVRHAKNSLKDEYSRNLLDSACSFYMIRNEAAPHYIMTETWENEHPVVKPRSGDVVLDIGISGDTSSTEDFLTKVGKNGMVIGIEANPKLINIINNKMKNYKNFKLYNYAVWNEDKTDDFDLGDNPDDEINLCGHVADEFGVLTGNLIKVEFIKLDTFAEKYKPERIDFLKMDIEGAEQQALTGGIKMIRKYKPDLHISCHRPDDHYAIVNIINSISPEYDIYLAEFYPFNKYWRNYVIYATVRNKSRFSCKEFINKYLHFKKFNFKKKEITV